MDSKTNRPSGRKTSPEHKAGCLGVAGLAAGLGSVLSYHTLLGVLRYEVELSPMVSANLAAILPLAAVVLSLIGFVQSDSLGKPRKMALAGLVFGLISLVIAGLMVYSAATA